MDSQKIAGVVSLIKDIASISPKEWLPSVEGQESKSQSIVFMPLVSNTRVYIEKVGNQINGCYENGWFDACAVMIRRLLETLIIEVFEHFQLETKIKKNGDYMYLRDLINIMLAETAWTLSRNTKNALPKLKDIGDKSAHSRRFIAIRHDIEEIKSELRSTIQELVILADIKRTPK
jgi:hypothetical protein